MATRLVCDRCTGDIEKEPCSFEIIHTKQKFSLCNTCWKEWLSFMGRPFYKLLKDLPDRTKVQK